jgi:hypothetical protein
MMPTGRSPGRLRASRGTVDRQAPRRPGRHRAACARRCHGNQVGRLSCCRGMPLDLSTSTSFVHVQVAEHGGPRAQAVDGGILADRGLCSARLKPGSLCSALPHGRPSAGPDASPLRSRRTTRCSAAISPARTTRSTASVLASPGWPAAKSGEPGWACRHAFTVTRSRIPCSSISTIRRRRALLALVPGTSWAGPSVAASPPTESWLRLLAAWPPMRTKRGVRVVATFRPVPVFDVAQTAGSPLLRSARA